MPTPMDDCRSDQPKKDSADPSNPSKSLNVDCTDKDNTMSKDSTLPETKSLQVSDSPENVAAVKDTLDAYILQEQNKILTSMAELIQTINTKLEVLDASNKPIPQVSATSSGTWNALSQSAKQYMDPAVERWRSGLDALLVFIGLFTAITTALYVESSKSLDVDQAKRTNDLLVNLTEIYIAVNTNISSLNFSMAVPFTPEAEAVRVNIYWSLSLVTSISVAALAISCRAFLTSLNKSEYKETSSKLTEIYLRWKEAEILLGPFVDLIHQIMVLPVALFIAGFLVFTFKTAFGNDNSSAFLKAGWTLSACYASATALAILGLVIHGILNPQTLPFHKLESFGKALVSHLKAEKGPFPFVYVPLERYGAFQQNKFGRIYPHFVSSAVRSIMKFFCKADLENTIRVLRRSIETANLSTDAIVVDRLCTMLTVVNLDFAQLSHLNAVQCADLLQMNKELLNLRFYSPPNTYVHSLILLVQTALHHQTPGIDQISLEVREKVLNHLNIMLLPFMFEGSIDIPLWPTFLYHQAKNVWPAFAEIGSKIFKYVAYPKKGADQDYLFIGRTKYANVDRVVLKPSMRPDDIPDSWIRFDINSIAILGEHIGNRFEQIEEVEQFSSGE